MEGTIPALLKIINPSAPSDIELKNFNKFGLNGAVVSVLGDPNSFRFWKIDPYKYVMKGLNRIKQNLPKNSIIIRNTEDFNNKITSDLKVFVLGVEGSDFLQSNLDRIDEIYYSGVRLVTLVHFSDNCVGQCCMNFKGEEQDNSKGLTEFGETLIEKMNKLGMVIDLSHCNERTAFDVIDVSEKPIISSHTGPRALQNFPRYSSDELLIRIAKNGGVIGLWPFRKGKIGISDLNQFVEYAKYIIKLVGIEHVSIGTDINGVPSNMRGYKNLFDYWKLIDIFKKSGFSNEDIKKIVGLNFFRVLSDIFSKKYVSLF